MFWTDAVQASERLTGSVVNFDGHPTLIDRVESKRAGPTAFVRKLGLNEEAEFISLDNEKWNNFRDLPKLGWFNYVTGREKVQPFYIERRAVNTRTHGLSSNNTRVHILRAEGVSSNRDYNVVDLFRNVGYQETQQDDAAFPRVSEILMALDNEPNGVAFSPKFCIVVTEEGMKWLYRKTKRIGFFTGADSLNLFPKMGYYKEELQSCPAFDIQNVREF
jgi:hypothetical protein